MAEFAGGVGFVAGQIHAQKAANHFDREHEAEFVGADWHTVCHKHGAEHCFVYALDCCKIDFGDIVFEVYIRDADCVVVFVDKDLRGNKVAVGEDDWAGFEDLGVLLAYEGEFFVFVFVDLCFKD